MEAPSPSLRALVRRLLAIETATAADGHAAVRVCGKLRASLREFAGAEAFTSLVRRAFNLARAESPPPSIAPGDIEFHKALEEFLIGTGDEGTETAVAIIAHLLQLLITFIGEPLTLRVVREAWPAASLDRQREKIEESL